MYIIKIQGGLGNQLFQFVFSFFIKSTFNEKVYYDLSYFNYPNSRNLELHHFGIALKNNKFINRLFDPHSKNYLSKLVKNILPYTHTKQINFKFTSLSEPSFGIKYLEGYWQSEKYFKIYRCQILDLLQFPTLTSERGRKYKEMITSTNSVSVHVRRGDYLTDNTGIFLVASIDYYVSGMHLLSKSVANPKYFIFSDDIEWCKTNFKHLNYSFQFIDDTQQISSIDDMHLMSLCKHNIIANSSYSWWAAWLNRNLNKVVVAPKKWFNDLSVDTCDLCPPEWVLI